MLKQVEEEWLRFRLESKYKPEIAVIHFWAQVEAALEQIPRMFAASKVLDSCFGGAIEAAIEVLKAGTGGKIVAFVATLPKVLAAAAAPVCSLARCPN